MLARTATVVGAGIALLLAFDYDQTVGEAMAVAIAGVWLYTFWQFRKG